MNTSVSRAVVSTNTTQLELFSEYRLDDVNVSRILPRWDLLPLFVFSRQNQIPPDMPAREMRSRTHIFAHRDHTFTVEVKPAQIGTPERPRYFFPGEREQLIASAVRALAIRGDTTLGTAPGVRDERLVAVGCSVRQLRAELAATGHTMSHSEVCEGLEILSSTPIVIARSDASGPDVVFRGLFYERTIEHGDKRFIVLNAFESALTVAGEYRAINYRRMIALRDPVARWLFQYLHAEHRGAKHASLGEEPRPFFITLDDLLSRGILARTQTLLKTVNRVRAALAKLRTANVLASEPTPIGYREELDCQPTGGRRRVIGARWGVFLAYDEIEAIIDENAEAKTRASIYTHLAAKVRVESAALARANVIRRAKRSGA